MKTLKLLVLMSMDDFISEQNEDMDWMKLFRIADISDSVLEITSSFYTIVLGKKWSFRTINYINYA